MILTKRIFMLLSTPMSMYVICVSKYGVSCVDDPRNMKIVYSSNNNLIIYLTNNTIEVTTIRFSTNITYLNDFCKWK